jgi:hypothetical protein
MVQLRDDPRQVSPMSVYNIGRDNFSLDRGIIGWATIRTPSSKWPGADILLKLSLFVS